MAMKMTGNAAVIVKLNMAAICKLSAECVHASSFNMFKNRIDKYLVKAGYTCNKGKLHLG